jgi:hypothetical protein
MYLMDKGFQQQGCQGCEQAYHKAQYQNEVGFFDVLLPPKNHLDIPIFFAHSRNFVAGKGHHFNSNLQDDFSFNRFLCKFALR